jgi:light-regulated signal transduction histidine kinase (bacteriophytochrome)
MGHADAAGDPQPGPLPRYPAVVDLTNCDREPIHIPGTIQPHGVLFALSGADMRVGVVSANIAGLLGRQPSDLLGVALADLTDAASLASVQAAAQASEEPVTRFARVWLNGVGKGAWRTLVHAGPDAILLEVKLPQPEAELSSVDVLERFDGATRRLQAAKEVVTICACLAAEVRRLTAYDRVKVYRFARDWSGEVLAEDNRGNLPSYLGLHFPASDIPVQARELYVRNPERQIPDINYTPVPLVQADPTPFDLSRSVLRSVSPIHIQYLRNMQVGASMSVSILRNGALWGLIACHHGTSHYVPPELRQACVLLAQLAAWQLGVAAEVEITRRSVGVKAVEATLLQDTTGGRDYRESLLRNADTMLELMQAKGLVLSSNGSVTTVGDTPDAEALPGLLGWVREQGGDIETDRLAAHYPPAAAWPQAAGLLAVSLGGVADNMMLWFRPEIAKTVTWSGNPEKPVAVVNGLDRLMPRHSFAAWTEEVRGQSRPWAVHEVAAANGLRDMIVDVILRRSLELEQINARLARSNEELEAFAYIASHDLTEPLRQIETFGTLIGRAVRPHVPPETDIARWFDGIQTSSRRLRMLIRDLAEYSRLGRHANPMQPTNLGTLVAQLLGEFASVIEATHARIEVDPLPVVMCDPVQMQQVFQNLISNALKYRHRERSPVVRITAAVRSAATNGARASLPVLEIAVADNGIGFGERHRERIFEPFYRLHSTDDYEGSGIGLAICRKIMSRHGGTVIATSQSDQGSVFTLCLPVRPLPE